MRRRVRENGAWIRVAFIKKYAGTVLGAALLLALAVFGITYRNEIWAVLTQQDARDAFIAFVHDSGFLGLLAFLGLQVLQVVVAVLPGEPVSSGRDSIYSYYPPSDIGAWCRLYLEPLAGKVAKASPFRVYEIWNEAWSYYRLRGLHGTPGEAMQLFRESYEALKKADPEAMVYPTDTGAALKESPYAFREFGRDMFELGYLRWADLMSYHSYGMMDYGRLENYRANMWNYGRDFEMWSTETAASGQPFHRLMESLLSHRVWGNGKTFIYNGSLWAPLYSDGRPHKNLVAMAAMIRP